MGKWVNWALEDKKKEQDVLSKRRTSVRRRCELGPYLGASLSGEEGWVQALGNPCLIRGCREWSELVWVVNAEWGYIIWARGGSAGN